MWSRYSVGFDSRQCKSFLFATASRPALWPTRPLIQCVPVAPSQRVKRPGREVDHSSPSSAEVKNDGAIPPRPILSSWHSAKPLQHVLQALFDHLRNSITGGGNMNSMTCYEELTDRFTSNRRTLSNSSCCLAFMNSRLDLNPELLCHALTSMTQEWTQAGFLLV
jgi:hypothetical protein